MLKRRFKFMPQPPFEAVGQILRTPENLAENLTSSKAELARSLYFSRLPGFNWLRLTHPSLKQIAFHLGHGHVSCSWRLAILTVTLGQTFEM